MAWTNPFLVATEDWKSYQGAGPIPALTDTSFFRQMSGKPVIVVLFECRQFSLVAQQTMER